MRHILQRHEEQLMDFEKNICLLCKRRFVDGDQINRHRTLSELHSSRLKRLRQRLFSEDQLDRLERKEREALYRDRARERRLKFEQTDRVVLPTIKANYFPPVNESNTSRRLESNPVEADNKGAALLSKMGWREGTGLGKSGEGATDILKLDSRNTNLSYKEAVKKIMYQRYQEISLQEEV